MFNYIKKTIKKLPKASFLLISSSLFIFVLPLIENDVIGDLLNVFAYSAILLSIISIIEGMKKTMLAMVFTALILIWIMFLSDSLILAYSSFLFVSITLIITTGILISQIIKSKKVDEKVIIQTVSSYLLLGIIFIFINSLIIVVDRNAIGFPNSNNLTGELIYYSMITMTTIGYGDISPISPIARVFSTLFGVAGQLYMTVIVAIIVGKYINQKSA